MICVLTFNMIYFDKKLDVPLPLLYIYYTSE